ncbi:MAG TPA: polysaccharide deacetylase, partial [Sphingobium sp.]
MTSPVFFDPSGRRGLWARRAVALLLVAILAAAIAFATTLVAVRPASQLNLQLPQAHAARLTGLSRVRHDLQGWLPRVARARGQARPLTIGFYLPNNDTSIASLTRHFGQLDWVVPATIFV